MKTKWLFSILILPIFLSIHSCKKNSLEETISPVLNPVIPDLTTGVSCSVYGFITDEAGNSLQGATVQGGGQTITTDQFGYFRISTTSFPKSAGLIKVSKTGYFNGFRTFLPVTDAGIFMRVQLVPKSVTGNFDAGTGGTVTTTGGGKVTLPANAVVVAATGAAYSGAVNVSMYWYDPSNQEETPLSMPGDLRAINGQGYLVGLTTYGMLNVELYGSAGELLQVAPGKKANLSFPLPAPLQANAPATIPLWYFDENNGLWKEEGSATKLGDRYEGEVSHFTPWNVDVPTPQVNISAQLLDDSLNPLVNMPVFLYRNQQSNSPAILYTDSMGRIAATIPANSSIELKAYTACNGFTQIKTFNTELSAVNLGSFVVNLSGSIARFTGTVNKCNGQPVTDGYVLVVGGGYNHVINIQNGIIDYALLICPTAIASIVAIDRESGTQSLPQAIQIVAGDNVLGTVSACSSPTAETIVYSLDGGPATTLALPIYQFFGDFDFANDTTIIRAFNLVNASTEFQIGFGGLAVTGSHRLGNSILLPSGTYTVQTPPVFTNITTYGLIGEFIIGTINTTILDTGLNPHSFTCTITIRRTS